MNEVGALSQSAYAAPRWWIVAWKEAPPPKRFRLSTQHLRLPADAEVNVLAAQSYSQSLPGNNKLEESCIHGDH